MDLFIHIRGILQVEGFIGQENDFTINISDIVLLTNYGKNKTRIELKNTNYNTIIANQSLQQIRGLIEESLNREISK